MMDGPNYVEIDLSALAYNLRQIGGRVNRGTRIMGVVKSDAYGHGLIPVSRTLEENGIDCLGVAHLQEALELRRQGIKLPLMALCGIRTREECSAAIDNRITPVLFDLNAAERLAQESASRGVKTAIHIKVDTGMGRLGIPYDQTGDFVKRIVGLKHLDVEALTSHLSCAEDASREYTELQVRRFEEAAEAVRGMGLSLPFNNLANSAGVLSHRIAHLAMVRPGIILYGGAPSVDFASPVDLRPVMHFKGEVLQVRDLPDQTPVSYGRTYYTKGPKKAAVLSAGYGDGLPRAISNRGSVLIDGKRAPIIGRVCMNLTVSDVTGLGEVKAGDEVVFLGTQGEATITGDEVAAWAETISYEVFCSLGQRNRREYAT